MEGWVLRLFRGLLVGRIGSELQLVQTYDPSRSEFCEEEIISSRVDQCDRSPCTPGVSGLKSA